jgi:hypothetical protein
VCVSLSLSLSLSPHFSGLRSVGMGAGTQVHIDNELSHKSVSLINATQNPSKGL